MNRATLQVYTAGSFSTNDHGTVSHNIGEAANVAGALYESGCWPICPHTMGERFAGIWSQPRCIDGTLEQMRRCDAVVMIANWVHSVGARGEQAEAIRLGMPVFYAHEDGSLPQVFLDWLEEMEGVAA
jgi:hypothetical protein